VNGDAVLTWLKEKAKRDLGPAKVILFGSRARGTAHSRSDYDVAILVPADSRKKWAAFALDVQEQKPTLLGLDLVDLAEAGSELQDVIQREGVEI
jgi:predicted nucleotidyltransferase